MDLHKKLTEKEWRVPFFDRIENTVHSMRLSEKMVWYIACFIFVVSALAVFSRVNSQFLVEVPTDGGSYVEGIVGTPRFINPLLAVSDADKDLSLLLYSGLMKRNTDGYLIPNLAESYKISEDGLTYTFILRSDQKWSDGMRVTSQDVAFTILKAQTAELKSPKRANWEGVRVEVISETEIVFVLNQPYSAFLNNATIGIVPKHIWENVEIDEFPFSEFNIKPVGSGPFEISDIKRNSGGIPVSYTLKPRKNYALGKPHIDKVVIKFYQNEQSAIEALKSGAIDGLAGLGPKFINEINQDFYSKHAPLTRLFGVFFNQNQNEILLNGLTRKALDAAISKENIIAKVLSGFGTVASGPLPPRASEFGNPRLETTDTSSVEKAVSLLEKAGWKKDEKTGIAMKKSGGKVISLSLSLATSNVPELLETAKIIEEAWENIGAEVDLRVFEASDLNQNVIRTRKYDALLFGTVITNEVDLYAFWHSSQRNDPGLNIAMYTNSTADKLLEEIRKETDVAARAEEVKRFKEELNKDTPAIFLYAPNFAYFVPKSIMNLALGQITTPSDRFLNIHEWYLKTDNVWPIFVK